MLAELKKTRFPVELGLLLAFCLFLPIVEFWKNIALLAYAIAWLVNRARARDFGGPWRASDGFVLVWIGASYLAAAFAGLGGAAWAKTGDVAVSALLFWLVARAGYGAREIRWLLGTLILSTLLGLVIGYLRLWSGWEKSRQLQLYSVGHVNHTAIYLTIILGVCASWLFARWRPWRVPQRIVALATVALVFASLIVTASRGAIGVGCLLLLVLAIAWWPRWRAPLLMSAASITIACAILVVIGATVVRKQAEYVASGNLLSNRDGIWRTGVAGWERYPWFGVGKDNYGLITKERIHKWQTATGQNSDESRYLPAPHGHSLFVTVLAERGGVGIASLLLILGAALIALLRRRPLSGDTDADWLAWGGAASAWVVTVGVGTVNTTLHHEHGLLAALLLALWLSSLHSSRASS